MKRDIIRMIAERHEVERIVSGYSRDRELMMDLAQEIYLILIEYDEHIVCRAWECGQLNFLIRRIAKNQFFSNRSPFYKNYLKFRQKTSEFKYGNHQQQKDDEGTRE